MTNLQVATNAGLNKNIVAPARKLFNTIDFEGMDKKRKNFITEIVIELEKAQTFDFSSKYRYIRVGLVLIRAKDELALSGSDWKEFYEALGLKEKVEERCRKIAKNKWFAKFTEEDAPKLHHLTQANMLTMSKEDDEKKFNEMLDEKYDFSPTPLTEVELKKAFEKAYKKAELKSISFEDYKEYCASSISSLIKILDETLSEVDEPIKVDEPSIVSAQLKNLSIGETQSSYKKREEA